MYKQYEVQKAREVSSRVKTACRRLAKARMGIGVHRDAERLKGFLGNKRGSISIGIDGRSSPGSALAAFLGEGVRSVSPRSPSPSSPYLVDTASAGSPVLMSGPPPFIPALDAGLSLSNGMGNVEGKGAGRGVRSGVTLANGVTLESGAILQSVSDDDSDEDEAEDMKLLARFAPGAMYSSIHPSLGVHADETSAVLRAARLESKRRATLRKSGVYLGRNRLLSQRTSMSGTASPLELLGQKRLSTASISNRVSFSDAPPRVLGVGTEQWEQGELGELQGPGSKSGTGSGPRSGYGSDAREQGHEVPLNAIDAALEVARREHVKEQQGLLKGSGRGALAKLRFRAVLSGARGGSASPRRRANSAADLGVMASLTSPNVYRLERWRKGLRRRGTIGGGVAASRGRDRDCGRSGSIITDTTASSEGESSATGTGDGIRGGTATNSKRKDLLRAQARRAVDPNAWRPTLTWTVEEEQEIMAPRRGIAAIYPCANITDVVYQNTDMLQVWMSDLTGPGCAWVERGMSAEEAGCVP